MGYNVTVVLMQDARHEIERDPDFGRRLFEAAEGLGTAVSVLGRTAVPVDAGGGRYGNAAHVAGVQHSSETKLFSTHGNICEDLSVIPEERFPIEAIERELRRRGYAVVHPTPTPQGPSGP